MSSNRHEKVVLSGLFPNRIDLLEELRGEVTDSHFTDPTLKFFFQLVEKFQARAGGVLTKDALLDLLGRAKFDAGRVALYTELYDELVEIGADETDFRWSIGELKESFAERGLSDALKNSATILTSGITDSRGEVLIGQEDARGYLTERLANLDQELSQSETPHGDIKDEALDILEEYEQKRKARAENRLAGVRFGIPNLDQKVGGLQPGELVISAGYSSDGKSALCVQLAWSAAIEQGKNVLFLTTETVNTVIRRRLVSRHSRHSKFERFGHPEGLNSRNLKDGSLNDSEFQLLEATVKDFESPDYGHLYIHQIPRMASMEVVEQIMNVQQKKFNIDLVICDYLALLRPIGQRSTDRESLAGILKNAKQISTTFNKGQGVPFISPWQVNRAAKESANQIGMYTSQSLAETAEATNTPDVIVSILAPVDNTERYADITGQVLKNRDGETANGLQMNVDYATSAFFSSNEFQPIASNSLNLSGPSGLGAFDL